MTRRPPHSDILQQIRACLDAATSQPGLVKASVYQTEGYLRGLQGLSWETPVIEQPEPHDIAALFLRDIRSGAVALRGKIKKGLTPDAFLKGFFETFPEASEKNFVSALGRLWLRWSDGRSRSLNAVVIGRQLGCQLRQEYEEGVAGELSPYLLGDRLHLRNTRDFLRMRGWLQGITEYMRRQPDWSNRERAKILEGNLSSIVLRALHNANANYAGVVVAKLPQMMEDLDRAIEKLTSTEPEAAHFLRKNRSTILTHALHSGYLQYASEAASELPRVLKELNAKASQLETTAPEEARSMRNTLPTVIYRALTNGRFEV